MLHMLCNTLELICDEQAGTTTFAEVLNLFDIMLHTTPRKCVIFVVEYRLEVFQEYKQSMKDEHNYWGDGIIFIHDDWLLHDEAVEEVLFINNVKIGSIILGGGDVCVCIRAFTWARNMRVYGSQAAFKDMTTDKVDADNHFVEDYDDDDDDDEKVPSIKKRKTDNILESLSKCVVLFHGGDC